MYMCCLAEYAIYHNKYYYVVHSATKTEYNSTVSFV